MAATAKKYLTVEEFEARLEGRMTKAELRAELDPIKDEVRRISMRTEVLSTDLHRLTLTVGGIAADLSSVRESVEGLETSVEHLDFSMEQLEETLAELVSIVEGNHLEIVSALQELIPTRTWLDPGDRRMRARLAAVEAVRDGAEGGGVERGPRGVDPRAD
jgi:archaellum component FlaC